MRAIILGIVGLVMTYLVYYVVGMVRLLRSPDTRLKRDSELYLRKEGYRPRRYISITRGLAEDTVTWLCDKGKRVRDTVRDSVPIQFREEDDK